MQDGSSFQVALTTSGPDCVLVSVAGELDLFTAPQLGSLLDRSIEQGATSVTVDLSEVTFLDAAALGVLVRAAQHFGSDSGTLRVICPDARLRRLFEITGLDEMLTICASGEGALAAR